MSDKTDWVVAGFQFGTQQDAELAKNEELRIKRLEEKLDYNNSDMVYAVYEKAINNRVFKTPVGYDFLKKLQKILEKAPGAGYEIYDIPVSGVYSLRESTSPAVERVKASRKKTKPKPTREYVSRKVSIIINIVLVILIITMFYISITGSNPTILNYEKAIQNRYAQWEEELSEREAVIRDKEKELLINE
jgi:hypothetical protein